MEKPTKFPVVGTADKRAHPPPWRGARRGIGTLVPFVVCGLLIGGCKSSSVTEVRGKTSFGPEFRNRGNNTSEVRYDVRQAVDMKWDNGWTTGVQYRRRDVDEGSGDNENRVLLEVGYPIWKAPKKPDKTTQQLQELEEQVQEMRARVAELRSPTRIGTGQRIAEANDVNGQSAEE